MKKKLVGIAAALFLMFSCLTPGALAKEGNGKQSLVAIGDSIPFGYNLGNNNNHPSKLAYPSLIGEDAGFRVRNLGVPGWTTENLLSALQNDQKFRQAIRHADYVTLSIGSNDLLREFSQQDTQTAINSFVVNPGYASYLEVQNALHIPELIKNLQKIVSEVQSISDAEVIVYNIYNPFPTDEEQSHAIAKLLLNDIYSMYGLPSINSQITDALSSGTVEIADAFSVLQNNDSYLIDHDIHPTVSGQQRLAEIGYQAIQF